jgi:hypothetical protein
MKSIRISDSLSNIGPCRLQRSDIEWIYQKLKKSGFTPKFTSGEWVFDTPEDIEEHFGNSINSLEIIAGLGKYSKFNINFRNYGTSFNLSVLESEAEFAKPNDLFTPWNLEG